MASEEPPKRKRVATDPIDKVNEKSDEQFIREHLCPGTPTWTKWTHPTTKTAYTLSLTGANHLASADLGACHALIEETSRADYENSTRGWHAANKKAEMQSPELRYLLVKREPGGDDGEGEGDSESGSGGDEGGVRGFASLMPTYEEGEPVVYCYELHLKPDLRGTGLGKHLLSFLESVAAHTPPIAKVMLTCFLSNQKALGFYKSLGFVEDPVSPVPRKLRYGREFVPDFVILSKAVERRTVSNGAPTPLLS